MIRPLALAAVVLANAGAHRTASAHQAASASARTKIAVRSPAVAAGNRHRRVASASNDADAAARAAFHLAEQEEKDRKYADALGHYRDVLRLDPGNWFATTARARIEVLSLYDGSFAELAELDAIRRDPARSNDPGAVDALERSSTNWRGRVRAEALLFVAEARIGRLNDPARGLDPALAVARGDGDPVTRDAAWDLAWSAIRRTNLERAGEIANDPRAPAVIRSRVFRELRRRTMHRVSTGVVAAGATLLVAALAIAVRRGRFVVFRRVATRPLAIAFLIVTPLFAALIADAWDRGMGVHFAPLAGGLVFVHLLASAWRAAFGDREAGVRALGGVASALCVIAAAYLVLERGEAYGVPLLEGFGL